ncbi:MFS general substrate transporter [Pluteus cervinus]|uniref:MFS general substrate transporter n=1 Tax=Pluteus cervinus TaxID=181527 RepID=A0ACD3BC80_9AGAR|nr:MFS general substrate transporter [Pluteus cervinus]
MDPTASPTPGPSTLANSDPPPSSSKPFYRARPLWLVPFAILAALVRGMTLAPRVEVYTQLSCYQLHGHLSYNHTFTRPQESSSHLDALYPPEPQSTQQLHHLSFVTKSPPPTPSDDTTEDDGDGGYDEGEDDPRRLPSARCTADPAVQAGAAQLQTIMTVTMGILSALTAGWWGHFSEVHGRTKVLALSTFGLMITDSMFILASTPSSPLSGHGHKLLLIAPVVEGLLGGWSALQSATSAYISDCTSSGSRAHIFSRFTGTFYFGLSVGPSIGGWILHNVTWGTTASGEKTVTAVFYTAVVCSLINLVLAVFILPESLDKTARQRVTPPSPKGKGKTVATASPELEEGSHDAAVSEDSTGHRGFIQQFLSPLKIFLPTTVRLGIRQRTDWSLTLIAAALFGFMLSSGIYQLKYLYAVHIYGWNAEQLSYYVSFLGGARATLLLILLPFIIETFKPRPKVTKKVASLIQTGQKPPPSQAHLAREISFDLAVTRFSLLVDMLSNALVTLVPPPSYKAHHSSLSSASRTDQSAKHSQALFVLATALSSLGSGTLPAIQSLCLCIMQFRGLESAALGDTSVQVAEVNTGKLFGGLAVLQAAGQMIMAPLLFGLIYSETVATYPKAIFTVAAAILFSSLLLVSLVQTPRVRASRFRIERDVERGRSRVSKDLRRGVTHYGSVSSSSSLTPA